MQLTLLLYHEIGVTILHIRTASSNCTSLFYSLILLFVCPSVPFFVCNVSFVWSRLVWWCVQALNFLGVPPCLASFLLCVCVCVRLRARVSLDGLSRYNINMFPLIHPAVLSWFRQRQVLSSYAGNSRSCHYRIVWICSCLYPYAGSH